jgi:hypothetical protein
MPHKLRLSPDFSDYHIFGLSTHIKDYKLCWHINTLMNISMIRRPSLQVAGDPPRQYSLFVQKEASEQIDLFLLSNFDQYIPWFSKAVHFHYFFIIRGKPLKSQLTFYEGHLEQIPQMLLVTKLNPDEQKLVLPLLTDVELHITEISHSEKKLLKARIPKKVSKGKTGSASGKEEIT